MSKDLNQRPAPRVRQRNPRPSDWDRTRPDGETDEVVLRRLFAAGATDAEIAAALQARPGAHPRSDNAIKRKRNDLGLIYWERDKPRAAPAKRPVPTRPAPAPAPGSAQAAAREAAAQRAALLRAENAARCRDAERRALANAPPPGWTPGQPLPPAVRRQA